MTLKEAYEHFGSFYKLSKVTGICTQHCYTWKTKGYIPVRDQMCIEKKSGGKLKADCSEILLFNKKRIEKLIERERKKFVEEQCIES